MLSDGGCCRLVVRLRCHRGSAAFVPGQPGGGGGLRTATAPGEDGAGTGGQRWKPGRPAAGEFLGDTWLVWGGEDQRKPWKGMGFAETSGKNLGCEQMLCCYHRQWQELASFLGCGWTFGAHEMDEGQSLGCWWSSGGGVETLSCSGGDLVVSWNRATSSSRNPRYSSRYYSKNFLS